MPRSPKLLPAGVTLADKLACAQLHRQFPLEIVKQVLEERGVETKRKRELPNEFMAYYPILLCLYRDVSQTEVLRVMAEGLDWLFGMNDFKITGKSGISQARARVGSDAMGDIFCRCARPLANADAIGSFYKGMRLVGLDGTDLELEDCPENSDAFGRSQNQNGPSAYPKARVVALVEIGTRAAFAAEIGKYSQSEHELAVNVIPYLDSKMLCLADQLFMSFEIFDQAIRIGAQLLFRARMDRCLEREQVLPDGSYLSTIYSSRDRQKQHGLPVRVIEHYANVTIDGKTTSHPYRLITTLLDWKQFEYNELIELYRQRWEFETMLAEMKTHLMGSQPLRSRAPDLVRQEIYGMLMAHLAIRAAMYEAAYSAKIDPDDLSFTHSKNVLDRNLRKAGVFSPCTCR